MAHGTVLVVDDEPEIVEVLRSYLEREGYRVLTAGDGDAALRLNAGARPDLVLLDVMLPRLDGWEVCRRIRQTSRVPIIMLTARDDEADTLVGLELGADDYVTKPFSPREVVARVRAVLRRAAGEAPQPRRVTIGALELDESRYEARVEGRRVPLTPTEFRLLHALAASPGQVLTRLQLIDRVQGYSFEGYERTIDVHVKNLRQKIEADPRRPRYIHTVHGVGYKLEAFDA